MTATLTLGEQLRALTEIDTPERLALVRQAREQHAEFWRRWYPFRCTEEGDAEGQAFAHVVDLFGRDLHPDGLRGLFVKFMRLEKRTLIIDVASGVTPAMLKVILRDHPNCAGYVAVEPAENTPIIRENFERAGYGQHIDVVAWNFWEPFPIQALQAIKRKRHAANIVTMTYWGATYLPRREIRTWVKPALVYSDAVYLNMLSEGRFQPEVLRRRFAPYLLRLVLTRRASLREALRAMSAIKKMSQFGREFAPLMPLWTAGELHAMLSDMGVVGRVNNDLLWGQTSFVEIHQ